MTIKDCPTCGARYSLEKIPKYRNGIQGRKCCICQTTSYYKKTIYDYGSSSSKGKETEWNHIPAGNMNYTEYEGLK